MEDIFKVGDKVFCLTFGGWGKVINEYDSMISCSFPKGNAYLTKDGRYLEGFPPILSFTEYTLNGFSQERPEELPKKGQVVWVRKEFPSEWVIGHFYDKEENRYRISGHPKPTGWNYYGVEIRTTNPYKDEQD